MKQTKEVAPKTQAPPPAVYQQNERPEIMRSDIMVPYIVLAQGSSDSVKERKAQLGDIIRTTDFAKVGDVDKPLEIIFLHYPKANWIIEKKEGKSDRFQYVRTEPRNASNETLPWTFFQDAEGNEVDEKAKGAIPFRRVKQLLVFAILPQDIEAAEAEKVKMEAGELPDPSKALTPGLVSFRSTSYKAGKDICTFWAKADSMGAPIWKYSLTLGGTLEKNDDGSFYVWKVDAKGKPVKKEYLPIVEKWVGIVAQGNLQVDESQEYKGEAQEREANANAAGVV